MQLLLGDAHQPQLPFRLVQLELSPLLCLVQLLHFLLETLRLLSQEGKLEAALRQTVPFPQNGLPFLDRNLFQIVDVVAHNFGSLLLWSDCGGLILGTHELVDPVFMLSRSSDHFILGIHHLGLTLLLTLLLRNLGHLSSGRSFFGLLKRAILSLLK